MKKKTYKLCYLEGNKAIFTDNFEHQYNDYFDIDTLYDLIQAGLVEKVEE